ncbi:MAG: TonB-dependent receptor [Bacteroidales bacterium]|nr:TonB-dependent receptor [Bacteroidales bacterium]MBQ8810966.1 TonB-dependent receptor [Bacteroidales bacterium]
MKNLTYKISLLILGLFATAFAAQAQEIRGVVSDVNGDPLIGVSVFVDGTTLGVSTGVDGSYAINVPDAKGKTLVFSMIGLADKRVTIGNETTVNVVLEEDANFLEETVVVGYATVKRRDLLGSVSSVNSEKIAEQPVTSVSQALGGRMAGVSVVTTEGDPDADIKIRVRGGGSITQDNSPLYIVDGFPVESINDISSSEIQSIDVLKDAFSTAIYGSRGANGVVIVTTKSGEKGRKVSVNLNAYYGFKKMANADAIRPMDSENFVKFQYELAAIRGNVSDKYEPYFGKFSDIDLYTGLATNDWVGMVFGNTGQSYNTDLSVSGSGENYQWTLGYSRLSDDAIMSGSNYLRNNLNMKAQYRPHKKVAIDVNLRYSNTNVRGSGANSINDGGISTSGNGRLKHAVSYTPIPLSSTVEGIDLEDDYQDNAPPLKSVADNDSRRERAEWNVNGALTWEIFKNFRLKVEGGYQDYEQIDNKFLGLTTYYAANNTYKGKPSVKYTDYSRARYRNTNTLSYDFSDVLNDRHALSFLLGEEMIITKSSKFTTTVENFPESFDADKAWHFLGTGVPVAIANFYNPDDRLLSFFGRVNYEFDRRYSVAATLRADGSSKFGPGNRWGIFPSAAAFWRISAEPWMQGASNWLDELKLRYSYGTAGNNNIPSDQIMKVFSGNNSNWISQGNNHYTAGTVMNNPDLRWETTITHNVGLDFSFFSGKLAGSVEVYKNNTKDLLIEFPIAGTGYQTQYRNVGETQNQGLEISLNLPVVQSQNFDLSIDANIAFNQNSIVSLGGLDQITGDVVNSRWASSEITQDYLVQAGMPLGQMYGFICDGRYEADDFTYSDGKWVAKEGVVDNSSIVGTDYFRPGAIKYKDLDGDGKITESDKTVIGNAYPVFQGGFAISGYLYGFDFSANFNYVYGNDIYNANKIEFTSSRKYNNRNLIDMMNVDNRWTNVDWSTGELITDPEQLAQVNANTTMWSPAIGNGVFSDWAVEDGSFLRLQSATIGYTFPEKMLRKASIRKIRVYATGTNLFCLTNYSGYDPEVDSRRASPLTPGVDYSAYPKSIGVVFGVNLTF